MTTLPQRYLPPLHASVVVHRAHRAAVVGEEDDNRVFTEPFCRQKRLEAPEVLIDVFHHPEETREIVRLLRSERRKLLLRRRQTRGSRIAVLRGYICRRVRRRRRQIAEKRFALAGLRLDPRNS